MAGSRVIDADGHIIERTDELRKYLKSRFNNARRTAHSVRALGPRSSKPCRANRMRFPARPTRRTGCGSWTITISSRHFYIRRRLAMSRASVNLSMRWRSAKPTTIMFTTVRKTSNRSRPVAILPFQDPEKRRDRVAARGARSRLSRRGGAHHRIGVPLGHKFSIRFTGRRKLWAVLSLCMAPTAPKNWPRAHSRPSPKFTRSLFRWACLSSFPT